MLQIELVVRRSNGLEFLRHSLYFPRGVEKKKKGNYVESIIRKTRKNKLEIKTRTCAFASIIVNRSMDNVVGGFSSLMHACINTYCMYIRMQLGKERESRKRSH